MSHQERILTALSKAVVEYRIENCRLAALRAIEQGIDPKLAVMEGLVKGMKKAGILYDTNEYFVPEVLLCSAALYEGLNILRPHIRKEMDGPKATVVIGCVKGDIHDIGKNLIKVMFDTAGWEVHDLGSDVPFENFVEKQMEVNADIIAMSAMMTTTMMGIKKVISMVRSEGLDCSILIGGAPVTRDIADLFGADGYAASAGTVVSEGLKMLARSGKHKAPTY